MSTQLPADWESRPWRMLDADEVGKSFRLELKGVEGFVCGVWGPNMAGDGTWSEYRTRYTRAELRAARGLEPEAVAAAVASYEAAPVPLAYQSELDAMKAENAQMKRAASFLKDYQGGGLAEDVVSACEEVAAAYGVFPEGVCEGADDLGQAIQWLIRDAATLRALNAELVARLMGIIATIEAHDVGFIDCDRRGNTFCDCVEKQVTQSKAALAKAEAMKGAQS